MSIELTDQSVYPWLGGWGDWYFEKPDGTKGVVTYHTLGNVLKEAYDEENPWSLKLMKLGPGVYSDDEIFDHDSDHCYTVVLNCADCKPGLKKELFKNRVDEMEEKFGLDLQVVVQEENCEPAINHEYSP